VSSPQPSSLPHLVATDLDGTIVGPDGEISDRTVRVLKAVEELGVPVVFVTGRPTRWMAPIAARTGHAGLAVCANGGVVYDLHTERVVDDYPMSVAVGHEVVRQLRAALPGLGFAVETVIGYGRERRYLAPWDTGDERLVDEIELIFDQPAVKLLARHESLDADALLAHARAVLGDTAELTHSSFHGLLEMSAAGVSKATTLARLCADRGIVAADVVAFGDMPNDLPMLAWAGTAYAVANAHPEVLAAVDNHAKSVEDDGVAEVLEVLFDL
jgi:Cof subfamily protein (haloacid dehalogenase superfamily)